MSDEVKREEGEISRREFLKDAGLIASSAALGSVASLAAAPAQAAEPVKFTLYDPTGAIVVSKLFNPRLDTLEGKTICMVSDDMWQSSRTFPLIADLLQKQFPTAKIIPWDKFPSGSSNLQNDAEMGNKLKAAGCQAAIVGNAG